MGCFMPEFTCVDHLHLCLVGRGLDREFQVTLEIFDWVYVWTLLSLRQPSVVLSRYLRPWDQSPCPSLYGIPPHHDASTTDKLGSIILENLVCLRDLYMSYFIKWAFHWVEVSGWTLWSRLLILVDADLLIPWLFLWNVSSAVRPYIDRSCPIDWIYHRWTPIRVWVLHRDEERKSSRTTPENLMSVFELIT